MQCPSLPVNSGETEATVTGKHLSSDKAVLDQRHDGVRQAEALLSDCELVTSLAGGALMDTGTP
jgi:hypothetical protein